MTYYVPDEFPVDALPDILKHAVMEVETNTQAPMALIASSALGAISLACQHRVNVRRPTGMESPCSLFMLTIAESGERKTTADQLFTKPIRTFEAIQAEKFQRDLLQYQVEKLAWEIAQKAILRSIDKATTKGEPSDPISQCLADHMAKQPQPPRLIKLIYNDATPEAVALGLHKHWPSAGIVSDEGGSVLGNAATKNFSMANTLWSGGALTIDRRSSESFVVTNARLTISLMVQKKAMKKFCNKRDDEARSIGFLARFLVAEPQSTQGKRYIRNQLPSWQHLPVLQARLTDILNQSVANLDSGQIVDNVVLEFSPEAKQRWVDAYNTIESFVAPGGYLSDFKDYAAKAAENLARMAALFHWVQGSEGLISFDTVDRAARVCSWYTLGFTRFFNATPELSETQADTTLLASWLRTEIRGKGYFTVKKNFIRQRGPNPLRNKERLEKALQLLMSYDWIRYIRYGKTLFVELNSIHFS
ncbi:DUF3987 domain-containing protein [Undibacterium jejuense]|uniref:DUF3987 domain-containing protein n=2 Tax=Undibacterium jejuense TaxID=1344949 RepID=A0A923HMQ1_9BURK|nr:YfjI family protein [Undibacterium jejuense]MBC3863764.1 DUF3987 domain-containing protein [Undibacterium jejuense]